MQEEEITKPEVVEHVYQKPTEDNEEVLLLDNKMNVHKKKLLVNLAQYGQDFIDYGPIEIIENLFKEQQDHLEFREYLNNFDFTTQQAIERQLAPAMNRLDPKTMIYGELMGDKEKIKHSERHIHQTIEEFRNTINKTAQTCGVDTNKLKAMYAERPQRIAQGKNAEYREYIFRYIRPLYIQLRKEGYTSYDLTY